MTSEEGDAVAEMVLAVVQEVGRLRDLQRLHPVSTESTELWVPEDVEHIVCRRRRSS